MVQGLFVQRGVEWKKYNIFSFPSSVPFSFNKNWKQGHRSLCTVSFFFSHLSHSRRKDHSNHSYALAGGWVTTDPEPTCWLLSLVEARLELPPIARRRPDDCNPPPSPCHRTEKKEKVQKQKGMDNLGWVTCNNFGFLCIQIFSIYFLEPFPNNQSTYTIPIPLDHLFCPHETIFFFTTKV